MAITVCVAGATGWTGGTLVKAILEDDRFKLTGAVARKAVGQDIGNVLGVASAGVIVSTLDEALTRKPDVVIDYTNHASVKANAKLAMESGAAVVIGTSGLTAEDFADLELVANANEVGLVSSGNFSITATLAKHFSLIASKYIPHWEIMDYAKGSKVDVPSGTVRELAETMGEVSENQYIVDPNEVSGPKDARGAEIGGSRVHSVRLPGYIIAFETLFGLPNERLSIRHDAGAGAEPYVGGTLLAATKAIETKGLVRGLDKLLFSE